MSDVTDMRCAVSSGDFAGAASGESAGTLGTSGAGEFALLSSAVDVEERRLFSSDRERDCERSECESGRGVISEASSKLSCGETESQSAENARKNAPGGSLRPCLSCGSWWAGRACRRRWPWRAGVSVKSAKVNAGRQRCGSRGRSSWRGE